MATNNLQATLTPEIRLTDELATVFRLTGACLDPVPGQNGTWYVFWEDGITEPEQWDDFDPEDWPVADKWAGKNLPDILRETLAGNPDTKLLTIEGAWTCSRMRAGEFGGFGLYVTRQQFVSISSSDVTLGSDGQLTLTTPAIQDFTLGSGEQED
jgi:hypothetical protein